MDIHRLLFVCLFLLLALVTGFWLDNSSKLLHSFIGVAHKLLAVACVVFYIVFVAHSPRPTQSKAAWIVAIVLAFASAISLFATGAMLTMPALATRICLNVHRVASGVAVLATGLTLRLVLFRRH